MTCIHHYSVIQSSFSALKILCALFFPSSPQPLVTTESLTVSIVVPFPECHRLGIIQYIAFSDGLLSLRNMNLSFCCVSPWLDSSFLFSSE